MAGLQGLEGEEAEAVIQADEAATASTGEQKQVETTTASTEQKVDAPAQPTMADVLKQIQAIQATVGRIPDLASRLDKMPKTFESTLEKRFKESQQQQYINSLPQDQQEAYKQQLAVQEAQRKEMETIVEAKLRSMNANGLDEDTVKFIQEQRAEKAVQADTGKFFGSIEAALGPEDTKRIAPYIDNFLKWHEKAINGTDEAAFKEASKAMDDALANPEKIALSALKWLQEQTAQAGGKVVQQRQQNAAKLSLAPRGSNASSGVKKDLRSMSAKELQADPDIANMSTEDYEKLLKASK